MYDEGEMIKISNSSMHTGNMMAVFSDSAVSENSGYLLDLSTALFARENLACHLVEISDSSKIDLNAEPYSSLLLSGKSENEGFKFNILEISLSECQAFDIIIGFNKGHIWEQLPPSLQRDFIEIGFSASIQTMTQQSPKSVLNFIPKTMSYLSLTFLRTTLQNKSKKLSPHLHKTFDPSRYVDANIPMFYTSSALVGMSEPIAAIEDV